MLQNYLHTLYIWADTNNMKFNVNKFELLRYGKEQEINTAKIDNKKLCSGHSQDTRTHQALKKMTSQ